MPTVRPRAHAKLNLSLALAPPEPQGSPRAGWHRIATWMHAIDLADDLLIEPLRPGRRSTWSAAWASDAPRPTVIDWPPRLDLAWRALDAIQERTGRDLPTRIAITKRIPTGSGLGGGSSDAAAALVGIDRAWGLGLGANTLRELGARLGSDVPFFIDEVDPPRPAVVSGFGETIDRTPAASSDVILLLPPFGCATGRVYGAFDRLIGARGGHEMRERAVRSAAAAARPDADELFNDLAIPACEVRTALASLLDRASAALDRPVQITGSGSTLFALAQPGETESLLRTARRAMPDLRSCASRLIPCGTLA